MSILNIQENVPMRKHLSFRAGGNARFFAEIESIESLQQAQKFANDKGIPVFILGKGTNVLIADSGYNGLIIKLGGNFKPLHFEKKEDKLIVQAGASAILGTLARKTAKEGFKGLHLLAGIPGTIGGGIYMNAGAYGGEISDSLVQVKTIDSKGNLKTYLKEECNFAYRSSIFQENKEWILEGTFELSPAPAEILENEINEAMKSRREKQPLDKPNAGSAFKRPKEGFPGALIEKAGLKGYKIGDAQVSEKHANFIVNLGNASAADIANLFSYVEQKVFENSQVKLKREVIFLGNFDK